MRVYIAGALSTKPNGSQCSITEYLTNVSKMCKRASEIKRRGYYPYVPALDLLLGIVDGDWKEGEYYPLGMAFLEVCDAVLVISDSWGVRKEVERAKELKIPVYYSLAELEAYNKL